MSVLIAAYGDGWGPVLKIVIGTILAVIIIPRVFRG